MTEEIEHLCNVDGDAELQILSSLEKNRPFLRDLQGVKFTEALLCSLEEQCPFALILSAVP